MSESRVVRGVVLAALLLSVLLGAANLYFGELNQDEGWYLYAARLVRSGLQPYRDFAFTQPPVMPQVYALAEPLVARFGLAGGRAFTWMLGLGSSLLAGLLAARLVKAPLRGWAFAAATCLVGVNVYHSYFTTVVKTYSLCALLLTGGAVLLVLAFEKRSAPLVFVASILLTLAAGTRLSAAAAWPVGWIGLILARRHLRGGWIAFLGGAILAAIPLVGRPLLSAPDGFLFGVLHYHAGRDVGGLLSALVYKAGFVSRFVQAYFVVLVLHLAVIAARWAGHRVTHSGEPPVRGILWGMVGAITLLHIMAPFPYDDYQVLVMPLYAAAVAAALAGALAEVAARGKAVALAAVLLICTASAFSSPINQSWFIQGRDRIWWRFRAEPPLVKLQRAGRWIAEHAPPGARILTQDTYLAVEANRPVMPGLELGPFSYYPDMPYERARKLKVMNRLMMAKIIADARSPVAAISGYTLAIRSPEIEPVSPEERAGFLHVVDTGYETRLVLRDFGQGDTVLRLCVPRSRNP